MNSSAYKQVSINERCTSFHQKYIIMYFYPIVHETVSLNEKCSLIRSVVKDRDHCSISYKPGFTVYPISQVSLYTQILESDVTLTAVN